MINYDYINISIKINLKILKQVFDVHKIDFCNFIDQIESLIVFE